MDDCSGDIREPFYTIVRPFVGWLVLLSVPWTITIIIIISCTLRFIVSTTSSYTFQWRLSYCVLWTGAETEREETEPSSGVEKGPLHN